MGLYCILLKHICMESHIMYSFDTYMFEIIMYSFDIYWYGIIIFNLKKILLRNLYWILEWFRNKIMIISNKFLNKLFPINNNTYHKTIFLTKSDNTDPIDHTSYSMEICM